MNATMGQLETLIVNSPMRAAFARREIERFRRMTSLSQGARVLDAGCGAGLTTRAIASVLRPAHLAAFDIDAGQVERAKKRLRDDANIEVRQASAKAMPHADGEFDAVFELGILHHIPSWREALPEIARVLRPAGVFCFAEPTKTRLTRGVYRIFPHAVENMFDADELRAEITRAGMTVRQTTHTLLWSVFGFATRP